MLPVSPFSPIWGFNFGGFDSLCPDMFTWSHASNWSKADWTAPSVRLGAAKTHSRLDVRAQQEAEKTHRRGETATNIVVTWDLRVERSTCT